MSKKKLLFVVDIRGWAFDNIAQFLSSTLSSKYDIEITYTVDFSSPRAFLANLAKYSNVDFIHFFYRGYLKLILEDPSSFDEKEGLDVLYKSAINIVVPDHRFLEDVADILDYQKTFKFVDTYYTTSSKLHKIYSDIKSYPAPYKEVIFDNILLEANKSKLEMSKKLVVAWIGNSEWGKMYFKQSLDPKGFDSIVIPTFKTLKNRNIEVTEAIINSKGRRRSREEVFDILRQSDILLITSACEGTPLPLIEAMSQGVAIITTDVGIASEVLPQSQKHMIVNADPEKFVSKIIELDKDRKLLAKLKKDNLKAYMEIFNNKKFFLKKWSDLIESSIGVSKERYNIKKGMLEMKRGANVASFSLSKTLISTVAKSSKLKCFLKTILKIPLAKSIAANFLFFCERLHTNGMGGFQNSIALYKSFNHALREDKVLALCHGKYPGVRNATKSFFEHTIIVPTFGFLEKFALPNFVLNKMAQLLIQSGAKKIIISGGGKILNQLAIKIKEKKEDLPVYLLWHGSPAQWSENHHLEFFAESYDLYLKGVYRGVISLKKDLNLALENYDIKSFLVQNFARNEFLIKKADTKNFTIGIWSAYAIWVKNLYPQFVALSFLERGFECHTNFDIAAAASAKFVFAPLEIKSYPSKLSHEEVARAMSKTDITLYVTNTECSPMIALESLALGIPCIVGPSSGLYDDNSYLKEMLVVNEVDSPKAIADAITRVRKNLVKIQAKIPAFVEGYNSNAEKLKARFLEEI